MTDSRPLIRPVSPAERRLLPPPVPGGRVAADAPSERAAFRRAGTFQHAKTYLLSPHVEQMQMARTDSVKPQNKVGLPVGESALMFLNIVHLSPRGPSGNNPSRGNKNQTAQRMFSVFLYKKKIKNKIEGGGDGGWGKNERVSSRERLHSVINSSEPCATGKNLKKINKKQNKRETSRSFSQSKKKQNKKKQRTAGGSTTSACYFCLSQAPLTHAGMAHTPATLQDA